MTAERVSEGIEDRVIARESGIKETSNLQIIRRELIFESGYSKVFRGDYNGSDAAIKVWHPNVEDSQKAIIDLERRISKLERKDGQKSEYLIQFFREKKTATESEIENEFDVSREWAYTEKAVCSQLSQLYPDTKRLPMLLHSTNEEYRGREVPVNIFNYIDGISLAEFITARKAITANMPDRDDIGVAILAGLSVCDALHFLHKKEFELPGHEGKCSLVHRDVRPRNVMVNKRGEITLIDFATVGSEGKLYEHMYGAPGYYCPEEISSFPLRNKVDIWGLGLVLYELITHEQPFYHVDNDKSMELSLRKKQDPMQAYNTSVADMMSGIAMECIVRKCMEKNPNNRYSDVDELRDVLCDAFVLYSKEHKFFGQEECSNMTRRCIDIIR